MNFVKGNPQGEWKSYYENGQLRSIGNYVKGKNNNEFNIEYYDNWYALENLEGYDLGTKHGEWKYYDENGQLEKTEQYKKGVLKY